MNAWSLEGGLQGSSSVGLPLAGPLPRVWGLTSAVRTTDVLSARWDPRTRRRHQGVVLAVRMYLVLFATSYTLHAWHEEKCSVVWNLVEENVLHGTLLYTHTPLQRHSQGKACNSTRLMW